MRIGRGYEDLRKKSELGLLSRDRWQTCKLSFALSIAIGGQIINYDE